MAGGRVDQAISALAEAATLVPTDATVWSDLAAAHLQRAAAAGDPHEYVLAVIAARRAVEVGPALLAAHFNLAVALAHLSLRRASAAEWAFLRSREQDSAWLREEAERAAAAASHEQTWPALLHQANDALRQGDKRAILAIVTAAPQQFREYIEENLLPTWAAEGGRPDAPVLAAARALAAAQVDSQAADTVAHLDALAQVSARRQAAVAGLAAYGAGLHLAREGNFTTARKSFVRARRYLLTAGSPFAGWATCQIAYCSYQIADYGRASRLLSDLQVRLPVRYRALHGRALWLSGLVAGIEGNFSVSRDAVEAAVPNFTVLREDGNLASVRSVLAYDLHLLGLQVEAWHQLLAALAGSAGRNGSQARSRVCETAAAVAEEDGDVEAALVFRDELVQNAETDGRGYVVAEALRSRAALATSMRRKDQALADLARAHRLLQLLADPMLRRDLEADILLVEGQIGGVGSSPHRLAALDRAVEAFSATSYHLRLGEALQARAAVEISMGRNGAAERDLGAAIGELEHQRERILAPEERIAFFDRRSGIFDSMIALQLGSLHQPTAALRFSEQAKARVLWDWLLTQPGGGSPLPHGGRSSGFAIDLPALVREIPAHTAVIEYAVLPQRTALWLLRRGANPRMAAVEIGSDALLEQVRQLNRAVLDRRQTLVEEMAARLYDALVRPLESSLSVGDRLIFVPDGGLHDLPFGLLVDRGTRRHLIEGHLCAVVPSLKIFAACLRRDAQFAQSVNSPVLVFADPAFDRSLFQQLPRLPAAETETSIAELFPHSLVLRGPAATRGAFRRWAGVFGVVHFGGHALINAQFPLLSQLVFAASDGDPSHGVLYSGDILNQRFPRTRLVVLASCATAAGKISRTEGVENLARPFLAAGVPCVVASLWPVADQETAAFFAGFYRSLSKSGDPASALQAAQLAALESPTSPASDPRSWAAFELIGACGGSGRWRE
jgi:CHAT domain-containing protein